MTGRVSFAPPSASYLPPTTLGVTLNGTAASGQYGQVQALSSSTGAINLANLALSVTFGAGFTPASGDSWTIIHGGAVTGEFVQGSYLRVGNDLFELLYAPTAVDLVYISEVFGTIAPISGPLSSCRK